MFGEIPKRQNGLRTDVERETGLEDKIQSDNLKSEEAITQVNLIKQFLSNGKYR